MTGEFLLFTEKHTENNQLALTQFKLAKPEEAPPGPPVGPALELLDGDAVKPDPDEKVKRWQGGGDAVRWEGPKENLASSEAGQRAAMRDMKKAHCLHWAGSKTKKRVSER